MSTHDCPIKGKHVVCPECERMVPDTCGGLEAAQEARDSLEELEATEVTEETTEQPKRRGRPPKSEALDSPKE